jgi:WD40 repeat protein
LLFYVDYLLAQTPVHLRTTNPPELVLGIGHSMRVNAVALSSDNRLMASASADNTIKLWEVKSGRELRTLPGHKGGAKCVAFTTDGKLLASGGNDKILRVWDVAAGTEFQSLGEHSAPVEAVAFSPDGRWLASGSADNTAKLWDVESGREMKSLIGHTDWITSVAFSPDGKWLATGSNDRTVRLWELGTDRNPRLLKKHTDRITALAFSGNGEWLASASADGTVELWSTASAKNVRSFNGRAGSVIAIAFADNNQQLLSASDNKVIKLWNVAAGHELASVGNAASLEVIQSVAFAADGKSFAAAADKSVELYDSLTPKKIRTFDSHAAGFDTSALSTNGHWFATGAKDNTIRLWDTVTGRELPALKGHTGYVTALAFTNEGNWLVSGSLDRTIRIWDTATGLEGRKLGEHEGRVNAVVVSPDDRWLATASSDRSIIIWDLNAKREARKLLDHAGEVTALVFSSDGKWLASGSVDQTIRIWDTTTWATSHQLNISQPVAAMAFSPDHKWLASAGKDTTVELFAATAWQAVRKVKTDSGRVRALAFSPDSRALALACVDRTLRILDVEAFPAPRVLLGHSDSVNAVSFTSDGKWIFSSSDDGTSSVWEAASGKKAATLTSLRQSDDWLVATPDGLFDGSPPAWTQILWRFADNTFNHLPVEAFFKEFFYPGLLGEILSGKDPRAPRNISQKDRRQVPVVVKWPPAQNATEPLASRTMTVQVQVEEAPADRSDKSAQLPPGGVRDVRLFQNGSLIRHWSGDVFSLNEKDGCQLQRQPDLVSPRRSICTATVQIIAGPNNLTAYAFNNDNVKSEDATLSITGAASLKRRGILYLLSIGVNEYENTTFNLSFAVPDAKDFGDELKTQQEKLKNYDHTETIPLYNGQANRNAILAALRDLASKVQPEDAVVVYFAGHGTVGSCLSETSQQVNARDRFYLVPHDLGFRGEIPDHCEQKMLDEVARHSLSDLELESAFENINAGQILLVIDACNSGQALESEERRRGPMNSRGLAQLAYEKGMYVLTAAQSFQEAKADKEIAKGHGYLTFALVEEGLKTKAAADPEGNVTLRAWVDYAVQRVPRMQQAESAERRQFVKKRANKPTKNEEEEEIQTPRVFYRREAELKPFVVARP